MHEDRKNKFRGGKVFYVQWWECLPRISSSQNSYRDIFMFNGTIRFTTSLFLILYNSVHPYLSMFVYLRS